MRASLELAGSLLALGVATAAVMLAGPPIVLGAWLVQRAVRR